MNDWFTEDAAPVEYATETITVKRRWPLWRFQGNQHNRKVKWFWKWDSVRDYYMLVAYDNLRFQGTTIIDTPGGTTVIGPSRNATSS